MTLYAGSTGASGAEDDDVRSLPQAILSALQHTSRDGSFNIAGTRGPR